MKKEQSTKFLKLCLADALLKMMESNSYDSININAICKQAGVGRTTYYRYFDKKNSKEDLLVFKIIYEWKAYTERHKEEAQQDSGIVNLRFVYENRKIFRLMYKNGLITALMKAFNQMSELPREKSSSYLRSFFVYGYFGVFYQWIEYDFDETPEQIQQHIKDTILQGLKEKEKQL